MGKVKLIIVMNVMAILLGCDMSSEELYLHKNEVLLKQPGLLNLNNREMHISILPKGSILMVLDKRYGKDYLAYKVETSDGKKGFILHSKEMSLRKNY
jgi:hypothetical protein